MQGKGEIFARHFCTAQEHAVHEKLSVVEPECRMVEAMPRLGISRQQRMVPR